MNKAQKGCMIGLALCWIVTVFAGSVDTYNEGRIADIIEDIMIVTQPKVQMFQ
jgi:hypothetical protein